MAYRVKVSPAALADAEASAEDVVRVYRIRHSAQDRLHASDLEAADESG